MCLIPAEQQQRLIPTQSNWVDSELIETPANAAYAASAQISGCH